MTKAKGAALGLCSTAVVCGGLWWYFFRPAGVSELLTRMPRSSGPTLYVDFGLLRRLGATQGLKLPAAIREADYAAFVEGSGFDFERDLDQLMVRFADGVVWVAATGRFDGGKLEGYAARQQGKCARGICTMPGSLPGKHLSWITPARGRLLLAAGNDAMAVAVMAQEEEAAMPFEPPASPVWLHFPGSSIRNPPVAIPGAKVFAAALQGTRSAFLIGAAGAGGLEIRLKAEFDGEGAARESAKRLNDATALFKALLEKDGKQPNPSDFSGIFARGRFEAQGSQVTGAWPVAKEFLTGLTF